MKPFLSEQDRHLLLKFLRHLRGGQSKVIITSQAEDEWQGVERCRVGVSGMSGEERWLFLEEILGVLGVAINREDSDLVKLMDLLNRHSLSML